jgi:hypothetical protein
LADASATGLPTTAFTLSAWINTSQGVDQYIDINSGGSNAVYFVIGPSGQTANKLSLYLGNWYQGTTSLNDGNWHYVAATWTGSAIQLYVSGVSENTSSATSSALANTLITIADRSSNYFTGSMDEVRIAGSARSANWLLTEFSNQSAPASFMTISQVY